jgi:hypothetical protein
MVTTTMMTIPITERHDSVISTPDSYSEGDGLDSRSGSQLY